VIARADEDGLTQVILALAAQYGRYGYRRITQMLKEAGWDVGTDRVQRIWRREGLKVPWKQKPRRRLWLNDGSCIRLRPERRNHVWSYDFVEAQTHDGRKVRLMTLIDEFTRAMSGDPGSAPDQQPGRSGNNGRCHVGTWHPRTYPV
jgi:transposase InsO family protein